MSGAESNEKKKKKLDKVKETTNKMKRRPMV